VNECAARRAAMQPRMRCFVAQRKPTRRRILNSAWLLGLATIRGVYAEDRRVRPESPAGHARLPVIESRWWRASMLRSRVTEFHYIAPVANLGSIVTHGVLSHNLAARLPHVSVAADPVQDRRAQKRVPRGRPLHDYANLYFDARNAMMYMRKDGVVPLTVVRLDPAVLDVRDSVITNGNAASVYTSFSPSPSGLFRLDEDRVYADWWDDQNPLTKAAQKRARCAELLVPDRVEPRFILGCYVDHWNRRPECFVQSPGLPVEVNAHVFFK
jgi:ssDNA thymidine ADP-ribosyltransferase, DarT